MPVNKPLKSQIGYFEELQMNKLEKAINDAGEELLPMLSRSGYIWALDDDEQKQVWKTDFGKVLLIHLTPLMEDVQSNPKSVRVKIAVAVDQNGKWFASGWGNINGIAEPQEAMALATMSVAAEEVQYWVEATLPLPTQTTPIEADTIRVAE